MKVVAALGLGLLASAAISTSALAADLMAPPPPEAAITSDWTGLYVGAGGTYIQASNGERLVEGSAIIGANLQTGMFLLGLQGKLTGSYSIDVQTYRAGVEGELRGGFVVADSAAVYGGVGAELYSSGLSYESLGVGVEFKASDNVGVDLEYKHYWPLQNTNLQSDTVSASLLWYIH